MPPCSSARLFWNLVGQSNAIFACNNINIDGFFYIDPEVVRQSPDMTIQMTGRKERLSWLIGFINENAVLDKVIYILESMKQ